MTESEQGETTRSEGSAAATPWSGAAADGAEPSRSAPRARPATPLGMGLGFALIAALMAVQPLAATTFLKLFYEKSPLLIQPMLTEDMPAPRSLVWPPRLFAIITGLGSMTSAAVLGLYLFFSLCFLYGLFRILNPTFRMTTGIDWDRHFLWKTYMHSDPVTKAFLIAIAAVVPAFVLWRLLGWALGDNAFSFWLRLALSGAATWFLFSREGIAGDYETGSYEPPRDRATRRSLLLRGAVAGSACWLMARLSPSLDLDSLFQVYRSIGFIGPAEWYRIAALSIGFAAAFGFVAGGLFTALGSPDWAVRRRIRAAIVPAAVLAAVALAGRVWLPGYFAARYDYAPVSSTPDDVRLARLAGLSQGAEPVTAYVLQTDRALPVQFTGQSVTHLAASFENGRAIDRYLAARDGRTSLSYVAYTTLHDSALLSWSVDDALRLYLLNLTRAPDAAYINHLVNRLENASFSPTPGVIAAVDKLTDDRLFEHADRRGWVTAGDMCARFGLREKAEDCYRRADMPASQVSIRLRERGDAPNGRIAGRLFIDRKPAAGARVGLTSERGGMQLLPLTDPGTHITSPFWLSWMGASTTTDKEGRFSLETLIPGRYLMVIRRPGPAASGEAVLTVVHGPGMVSVAPGGPPIDLGDIKIASKKPAGPL